jgi:membrane-associated protease RseP (regulator of RpoE activity)
MVLKSIQLKLAIAWLVSAAVCAAAQGGAANPSPFTGPRPLLYGFALECTDCRTIGLRGGAGRGGFAAWHYTDYPRVVAVSEGGAAERAGIKLNDVIVSVDGLSLLNDDGARRFSEARGGDKLRLTVDRDGKPMDVTMTLGLAGGQGRGGFGVARAPLRGGGFGGLARGRAALRGFANSTTFSGFAGTTRVEVSGPASVDAITDSTGTLVLHIGANTVRIQPGASGRTAPPNKKP